MEQMSGFAGLNKSKSQDSEESGNTSPKKKKGSEGKAEPSGTDAKSQSSRLTRGKEREEKRKQQEKKRMSDWCAINSNSQLIRCQHVNGAVNGDDLLCSIGSKKQINSCEK